MSYEPGYPAIIQYEIPAAKLPLIEAALRDVDGVRQLPPAAQIPGSTEYLVRVEGDSSRAMIELGMALAQCWLTDIWSLAAHQAAVAEIRNILRSQ